MIKKKLKNTIIHINMLIFCVRNVRMKFSLFIGLLFGQLCDIKMIA